MLSKENSSSLHLYKTDNTVAFLFCSDDHQLSTTQERHGTWEQKKRNAVNEGHRTRQNETEKRNQALEKRVNRKESKIMDIKHTADE